MLGRWEWIIIELVVLGLLVAELISVRRSMSKDRQTRPVEQEDTDTRT